MNSVKGKKSLKKNLKIVTLSETKKGKSSTDQKNLLICECENKQKQEIIWSRIIVSLRNKNSNYSGTF